MLCFRIEIGSKLQRAVSIATGAQILEIFWAWKHFQYLKII
jgi:hypothetical protein